MKDTPKRLPDAELEVMKALWQAGEPLTRPELEARLAQHHWASTTLLALLARLEAKGCVAREKQGRGYLYRAALGHVFNYILYNPISLTLLSCRTE